MARKIDTIIIHCAATPNGRPFNVKDIDAWHDERGFFRDDGWRGHHKPQLKAVGYHYVIRPDGVTEEGRHREEVGAHARGHNSNSIGICLIGTDAFTRLQWDALESQVDSLLRLYPDANVIGHREVNAHKTCPGFDVQDWLATGAAVEREHLIAAPAQAPETQPTVTPKEEPPVIGSSLIAAAATAGKVLFGEGVKRLVSKKARALPKPAVKGLLESKTIWGVGLMGGGEFIGPVLGAAIPVVAGWLGYEIDPAAAQFIAAKLMLAGGAILAVYGRLKASKPIAAA